MVTRGFRLRLIRAQAFFTIVNRSGHAFLCLHLGSHYYVVYLYGGKECLAHKLIIEKVTISAVSNFTSHGYPRNARARCPGKDCLRNDNSTNLSDVQLKNAISIAHGNSLSVTAYVDEDKRGEYNSVVVLGNNARRKEDSHQVQPSGISDDDYMNILVYILFGLL